MKIEIRWPWEVTSLINQVVVVVDLYAATTNISSLIGRGVKQLLVVNKDSVQKVKLDHSDALIIGESLDLPKDFFDVSNFPHKVEQTKVTGRRVIFMSTNGTRIIELAFQKKAKKVITCAFNNIESVVDWLKENKTETITIIPAGDTTLIDLKSEEDYFCSKALRDQLIGKQVVWGKILNQIRSYIPAHYHPQDFAEEIKVLLALNKYQVVPRCEKISDGLIKVYNAR